MKTRGAAPLILGLVLQACLLLTLVIVSFRFQSSFSIVDPERRFAEYHTLYEASSDRDYAYDVADNHFTPVAILGNASLSMLPKSAATVVFEILSFAALLGAGVLSFKALGVGLESPRERRVLYALAALLALFSAPLVHMFYAGNIDCFVLLLVASALFLMHASQSPGASDAWPRVRKNLDLLAGGALAFAAGLNPFCIVLLIPLLFLKRVRAVIGMIAGMLLLYRLSPAMWAAYFHHNVDVPEFFYAGAQNASAYTALHLLVTPHHSASVSGLLPYPALPYFESAVAVGVLLLAAIFVDLKLRVAAEPQNRVLLFASYIPFVLAVPFAIAPHALVLHLLMIPVIVALWNAGESRLQRTGLGIAVIGLALTQSFIPDVEPGRGTLIPFAASGMGTFVLLSGIVISKFGLLLARSPSVRSIAIAPPSERYIHWIIASATAAYFMIAYWQFGHCPSVVMAWLLTMALLYCSLLPASGVPQARRLKPRDGAVAAGLLLLFCLPYLWNLHDYPVQVNTDEFNAIHTMNRLLKERQDWFGVNSGYNFFPAGSFMLIGVVGRMLGGVTLEHIRQANALFGLGCVVAAYALFRQFYRWKFAAIGAVVLGASHVLLGLSRMAIRDNLPLLIELIALALFVAAWRRRHLGLMFLGGIVAGLGVYNYFSARIVLVIWMFFLFIYLLRKLSREALARTVSCAVVAGLGYAVCSAPMVIATYMAPAECLEYPKGQVILFPGGLQEVRDWEGTSDTTLAVLRNAGKGLTMFNNNLGDHANIYCNPGFGFVDPLTGVLLWLGVARIFRKRRRSVRDVLGLVGLSFWIPLSILLTKCPAFSRMLIMLPFVLMLALDGARVATRWTTRLLWRQPNRKLYTRVFVFVIAAICLFNGWAYAYHIRRGIADGDAPGSTMRFAESRSTDPQYGFYMVMDDSYPYFWYGKSAWKVWLEYVLPPEQSVTLLKSRLFIDPNADFHELGRPCTLFISGELFKKCGDKLHGEFPELKVTKITTSGDQLAVDLP